jgi:serine protease inhibitor
VAGLEGREGGQAAFSFVSPNVMQRQSLPAMKNLLLGFAAALLLTACQKEVGPLPGENPLSPPAAESPTPIPVPDPGPELSGGEQALLDGANDFAFRLFAGLRTDQSGQNIFFSPFSISSSLTMAFNGAQGSTKEVIGQVLGFRDQSDEEINASYKNLNKVLGDRDKTIAFTSANAIWYDERYELQVPFVQQNKNTFKAQIQGLNFRDPAAGDLINNWVKEITQGKIDKAIEQIRPDHVLLLVNAIYFKAPWSHPFTKGLTRPGSFQREDGTSKKIDLMTLRDGKYGAYEDNTKMVFDLPYGNGQFSLVLLVPKEERRVGDLARELNSARVTAWLSQAKASSVDLRLPKFTIEYRQDLKPVLTQLGMGEAFSDQANLGGMLAKGESLKISEVVHKTFLGVNEEGTEAAAVTESWTILTGYIPSVIIDRPFVFLIREKSTGTILFLGQLMNP